MKPKAVALPKAATFRMVLRVLQRRKNTIPRTWRNENQHVCYVLHKLHNEQRISLQEHDNAVAYINMLLADSASLMSWLFHNFSVNTHDINIEHVNNHRIKWMEHIIKELGKA